MNITEILITDSYNFSEKSSNVFNFIDLILILFRFSQMVKVHMTSTQNFL